MKCAAQVPLPKASAAYAASQSQRSRCRCRAKPGSADAEARDSRADQHRDLHEIEVVLMQHMGQIA